MRNVRVAQDESSLFGNEGKIKFLQEDVYNFLGHEIGIQSNSFKVLTHLRSMYGRFYQSSNKAPSSQQKRSGETSGPRMQVIDNLVISNELFITDDYHLYRLSRNNGSYHFTRRDVNTLTHDLSGFCDPLTLVQAVTLETFSHLTRSYHLIHAGAVSWEDKGIIFPANSRMGKTTMVLKLVTHGCKFLSDEVACLNPEVNVIEPFPRKVSIRHDSQGFLGLPLSPDALNYYTESGEWLWTLDIEDITPGSLSKPCVPSYILFLHGFGDKPRLEYISSSNGLFELLRFSISPIVDPASLLFKLAPLLHRIKCFNLVIGDPDETAELIMKLANG